MKIRPLIAVALLVLGVGCDDPEVQDKVASIIEYGAEEASVTCNVSPFVPNGELGGCTGQTYPLNLTKIKFIDGAHLIKARQTPHGSIMDIVYLNRQAPAQVTVEWAGELTLSVARGQLEMQWNNYNGNCPPEPTDPYFVYPLDSAPECIGRNLEAFGVTP